MPTTHFNIHWPSKVVNKPLVKPVLIAMATLFLLCLPLNQIPLSVSGIQHPATALSFLILISMICFGMWEVARQRRFSFTTLTKWLSISALFIMIPTFYTHAHVNTAIWHGSLTLLGLMLFMTFQQFSFNHMQRQYLLWLPVLSGWLFALPYLFPPLMRQIGWGDIAEQLQSIPKGTTSVVLLTALALSAYLLARTRVYKRTIVLLHIPLLLTPLLSITALMAFREFWLISITLVIVALTQPFLFRFCPKLHHGLWNVAVLLAFVIAGYAGLIPSDALFYSRFSPDEWAVIKQTIALAKTAPFDGVGLGQLIHAQLQFGYGQDTVFPILTPYPSWLVATATEGGFAIWAGIGLLYVLVIQRLIDAPNGTRLMLSAIILPSLIGISSTTFISTNPVLALLFVMLLYWIDNLSARYNRITMTHVSMIKFVSTGALLITTYFVISSVHLGEQALQIDKIDDAKLAQYQTHPWWKAFYQAEAEKRAFNVSIERNDTRSQSRYLRQKIRELATNPHAKGYQSLIELALLTGHTSMARQIKQEAMVLFPWYIFQPTFSYIDETTK